MRPFRRGLAVGTASIIAVALAAPATADTTTTLELEPDAAGNAVITAPGHYVDTDGDTFRTVSIASDGVTLDGLTFDGAGTTGAGVRNAAAGLSDIAVLNSSFTGYTGRSITFGFAEGTGQAGDRGAHVTIAGNTIVQSGTNATAIVLFDTDGATVSDNDISYAADAGIGQRGINLDGSSQVDVTGNSVVLDGPWVVQVSMSNAPVEDVRITNNTLVGTGFGVVVLSQRDVAGLDVVNNDITASVGSAVNSGGVAPVAPVTTFSDLKFVNNTFTATAPSPYFLSLRNLHTPGSSIVSLAGEAEIVFRDVQVTANRLVGDIADDVVTFDGSPGMTYDDIKVRATKS